MVKVSPTSLSLPHSSTSGCRLCIQIDSPSYSPGSKVTGRIHITAPKLNSARPVNLEFVGTEFCRWKEVFKGLGENKEETMTVTRNGNREIRRERISLNQLPGIKTVKFSFVLPKVLPASGAFEDGDAKGGVIYHLAASLPDETTPIRCANADLIIVPPGEQLPMTGNDEAEIKTCCCISCGFLKVKTALKKSELLVGEMIDIGVAIEGKQCTVAVSEVSSKLVQKVGMKTREGHTYAKEIIISETKRAINRPPETNFPEKFELLATHETGLPLCPTVKTVNFQCSYFVRVETVVDTLSKTVRTVEMPVHLSLDVIQVESVSDEDVCCDSHVSSPSLTPLQSRASALFRQFESSASGFLSRSELHQALSALCHEFHLNPPDPATIDLTMRSFDIDGNGMLDKDEFELLVDAILKPS